jgi:alpha-glucoside transport system permease protein
MMPTVTVVAVTLIINVLKIFDIVYVMTNGALGTEVIANRMYKEMFNYNNFGMASALAVLLLVAIIPVMLMNIRRFGEGAKR